jgi:hypothetical protein
MSSGDLFTVLLVLACAALFVIVVIAEFSR